MSERDVELEVKQLIVEQLGVDANEVTLASNLANDLGGDSLDSVELLMSVEEHFGVNIPDEEASKLQTVGQVIEFIKTHLNK